MSRFLIWIVTGISTVSLVTFTKSARTSNGIRLTLILCDDNFFQILELHGRRLVQLCELFQPVKLLGLRSLCERSVAEPLHAAIEAVRLARHSHLLVHGQAAVRGVEQGILFRPVHRHVVVAAHAGIDKLDDHFLADTFDVAVAPIFKGKSRSRAAALFHRTLVGSAGGMRLDLVRRTVDDVNAAAIGFPSGNAGREVFVRIRDAAIVLFFEFVFDGVGRGIAARPERFDELVALFVVRELLECSPLFVGDDPADVLDRATSCTSC